MSDEETPLDPTIDWVREHLHRYVATDGENGYEWKPGVPTLVLTHRGRRSGKLRRTPLIYGRDGDNYVVVASFGGAPDHPNWYYNLTAEPEVTIQDRGEEMPATARTAEGDEREALWSPDDRRLSALRPVPGEDVAADPGRRPGARDRLSEPPPPGGLVVRAGFRPGTAFGVNDSRAPVAHLTYRSTDGHTRDALLARPAGPRPRARRGRARGARLARAGRLTPRSRPRSRCRDRGAPGYTRRAGMWRNGRRGGLKHR